MERRIIYCAEILAMAFLVILSIVKYSSAQEEFISGPIIPGWGGNLDVLPDFQGKFEQNDVLFIIPFILTIVASVFLMKSKKKIFGKNILQYISPIKYYALVSVLVVISQYVLISTPIPDKFPQTLNLTQAIWASMVALSVYVLVKKQNFNFKQIFFIGVIYSIIIHGLKVSIRHFLYDRPIYYILDRFIYGSLLVFTIVIPLGVLFIYLKKKGVKI